MLSWLLAGAGRALTVLQDKRYLEQDGWPGIHPWGGIEGDARFRLPSWQGPSSVACQVSPPQELPLPGALQWLLRSPPEVAAGRHVASPAQVLPHLMPPLTLLIVGLTHVPVPRPCLLGLADHVGSSSASLWPPCLLWGPLS